MDGIKQYPLSHTKTRQFRLFKNLRLKIFQVHVVGHLGWLSAISHMKTRQFRLFKNLRLKIVQVHVVGGDQKQCIKKIISRVGLSDT